MTDFVDEASASLSARSRPIVANHVRSIETQTLDALLRIEELTQKLLAHYEALGATVTRVDDEIQVELPAENPEGSVVPQGTPLVRQLAAKPSKKKNPRSL